jgi:N utilization substance protein A
VIAAIEESLLVAARKSIHGASNVQVAINPKTGEIDVLCEKEVVEKVQSPNEEISLKDAQHLDPNAELGQFMQVTITPRDFGRIAAQKARQVIAQKLRGAERDVIYEEYRHRVNDLISGTVKRIGKNGVLIVDLGKVEGVLPRRHYPATEHYNIGDKVFALLLEVRDTEEGGAEVVLSRSHPEFVRQLMIQEIPEISDGTVTIERIVREAGYRTKVVVKSSDQKVDPVGACIGMRGTRIKNIVRELHSEKIDIIPFAQDTLQLLQHALAPIEIRSLRVSDDGMQVYVVVDDDSFAAAIGKKGLNVRLIGALIGTQLDIQKISDYKRIKTLERANLAASEDPALDEPFTQIEGISSLVVGQLVAEKLDTPRKLLLAPPEQLASIPGINLDMAEKILEQVRKQKA